MYTSWIILQGNIHVREEKALTSGLSILKTKLSLCELLHLSLNDEDTSATLQVNNVLACLVSLWKQQGQWADVTGTEN